MKVTHNVVFQVELPKSEDHLTNLQKFLLGVTSPIWVPVGILLGTIVILGGGPIVGKARTNSAFRVSLQRYLSGVAYGSKWVHSKIEQSLMWKKWQEGPVPWQEEFAEVFKNHIIATENLEKIVERYIQPAKLIYNLSFFFDKLVAENEAYLESLVAEKRPKGEVLKEYEEYQQSLIPISLALMKYYISKLKR